MIQEDKFLLLQDLCARLPYHTIVSTGEEDLELVKVDILNEKIYLFSESFLEFDVFEIKPYLRPMSNMTKEETKEFFSICTGYIRGDIVTKIDFYIKHHFDFRLTSEGLSMIEAGLALEAPEGMYK